MRVNIFTSKKIAMAKKKEGEIVTLLKGQKKVSS